jgi:hypothetical protein
MSDAAGQNSSIKIGVLLKDLRAQTTVLQPKFQRKAVWAERDKIYFIDTILRQLPFPEVFSTTVFHGVEPITQIVDGQQRLRAIIDYVDGTMKANGRDRNGRPLAVKPFVELDDEERQRFLGYSVMIRDLGRVSDERLREVFQRINATDYALKQGEKMHALFGGDFHQFCSELARDEFWQRHRVFPKARVKRMGDTSFCVVLVVTLLAGYYRRSEKNYEFLERYNSSFSQADEIRQRVQRVFAFLDACQIPDGSRAWKLTDLFSLMIEVDQRIHVRGVSLDPTATAPRLVSFFDSVDRVFRSMGRRAVDAMRVDDGLKLNGWKETNLLAYIKASTKASDDKYHRQQRAVIVGQVLDGAE